MIRSFKDKSTQRTCTGSPRPATAPPSAAERKLRVLDAAGSLEDLMLPSNDLRPVPGESRRYSLRIDARTRIYFLWREDGPHEVAIRKEQ